MSSRRNTGPDLNDEDLTALLKLRLLRIADKQLLELLPHYSPAHILRHTHATLTDTIERRVEFALHELRRLQVRVVLVGDEAYPAQFQPLADFRPPVLFCRGRVELFQERSLAVVGTRRSTEYGNAVTEMLATDFARAGLTVVSGLALGIDTRAHTAVLAAGGNTIGVLGCGIDVFYPQRNARLQERIATEGLLISEFCPGEPAMPHHFLQRNRLIALLGGAVVVVEAGTNSGTNNTVKWALDYGVSVFAVPGPIGREASVGTNALLRDGAKPILDGARDVLEQLPWKIEPGPIAAADSQPQPPAGGTLAARIFRQLGPVATQIDQIARRAGCEPAAALASLVELELDGHVRQLPGKRFMRADIRTAR